MRQGGASGAGRPERVKTRTAHPARRYFVPKESWALQLEEGDDGGDCPRASSAAIRDFKAAGRSLGRGVEASEQAARQMIGQDRRTRLSWGQVVSGRRGDNSPT
jgi:hypothetical protein